MQASSQSATLHRLDAVSDQFCSTSVHLHSEQEAPLFSPPATSTGQIRAIARYSAQLHGCGDDRCASAIKVIPAMPVRGSYSQPCPVSPLLSVPSLSPDLSKPAAANADKSHSIPS